MSHPFEGWSAINEGWDTGGTVESKELLGNLKTVASNFLGPVAFVLVGLWALKVLLSVVVGLLLVVAQLGNVEILFKVSNVLAWLSYPLIVLVGLAQFSLFRPIQLQAFEGRQFVGGIGDAIRLSREVFVKAALGGVVWSLSMCVGAIACGIGALIPLFFFSQTPYLAATTELSLWECMRRSYELNKAYWMPVLGSVVASLVVMFGIQGCGGAIVGMIGGAISKLNMGAGSLVINLGSDFLGLFGGALILVITASVYTTIQSVERGVPFHD